MLLGGTEEQADSTPRARGRERRRVASRPSRLKERQQAYAAIERLLDLDDPHRPTVMVLEGQAGLGKSALLNAAAMAAAHREWSVHVIRAGDATGARLAQAQAALAAAAAEAHRDQPVLVAVDDARSLPAGLWSGLLALCSGDSDMPLTVLVTTTPRAPGAQPSPLDVLTGQSMCEVVHLDHLSRDGVAELVAEGLDEPDPPEWLVAAVRRATGGNPLLVHRAIQALPPDSAMSADAFCDGHWPFPSSTVATWVLSHVHDAPVEVVGVLRATAILRDDADLRSIRDVAAALGVTGGVEQLIDDAFACGVLAEHDAIELRYPIVAESLYADIPRRARSAGHLAAAGHLRRRHRPMSVVARHLLHVAPAGDDAVAAALLDAARELLDLGDLVGADLLLARAADEGPGAVGFAEMLGLRARLAASAGTGDPAAMLRDAFAQCDEAGPLVSAGLAIIDQMAECGRVGEVVDAVVSGVTDRHVDQASRTELAVADALLTGRPEAMDRLSLVLGERSGGVATADPTPSVVEPVDLVSCLLDIRSPQGHSLERLTTLARRVLPVEAMLASRVATPVLGQFIDLLARIGDDDAVSSLLSQIDAVVGHDDPSGWRTITAARVAAQRGALIQSAALLEALLANPGLDDEAARVTAAARLSSLYWLLGREQTATSLGSPPPMPHGTTTTLWRQLRVAEAVGFAHIRRHDLAAAIEVFGTAAALAVRCDTTNPVFSEWRMGACLAWCAAGDKVRARSYGEASLDLAVQFGAPMMVARSAAALAMTHDGAMRVSLLLRASDIVDTHPSLIARCLVALDLGEALLQTGDTDAALERLRRGADLAVQMDAAGLMARAHQAMLQAGARPRRLAQSGVASLTQAEFRVAALVAAGKKNTEVAAELFIGLKTVESHLARVYRKMHVTGRAELIRNWSSQTARLPGLGAE